MDSGCGSSFHVNLLNISSKFRIPKTTSIFTAELFAIYKALEWVSEQCERSSHNCIAILSDSLSALDAIQHRSSTHHLISKIFDVCLDLLKREINIAFIWIPGHEGVGFNRVADTLAKEAAGGEAGVNDEESLEITLSECKTIINEQSDRCWTSEFNAAETGLHYRRFTEDKESTKEMNKLDKQYSTTLFRLQTGHCKLNGHLHRIGCHDDGLCETCYSEESVEHFLVQCSRYDDHRTSLKGAADQLGICFVLDNLLSDPRMFLKVVEFVNATGRAI